MEDETDVLRVGDGNRRSVGPIGVANLQSVILINRMTDLRMLPSVSSTPFIFNLYRGIKTINTDAGLAGHRSVVQGRTLLNK